MTNNTAITGWRDSENKRQVRHQPRKSKGCLVNGLALFCVLFAGSAVAAIETNGSALFSRALRDYRAAQYSLAVLRLDTLLSTSTDADLSENAMMLKAECLLRDHNDIEARRTLALFQKQFYYSRYAPRALYWYAVALIRSDDSQKGAASLARVLELNGGPVVDSLARAGLRLYLDTKATDADLIALEQSMTSPALAALFRFERAQKLRRAGKTADATALFESFLRDFPSDPRVETIQEFLAQKPAETGDRIPVALLVPLEGEYKEVGNSVRNGAELALDQWQRTQNRGVELQRIDTRGNVVTAVLAAQKLIRENKVRTIVGPILTEEVVAAAAAMGTNGIPIITPTATGENITAVCPTLYQVSTSPGMLCRRLARYAKETLRLEEFVIIAPITDYGKVMSEAFGMAVKEMGGKCTSIQYYPEGETNFRRLFQEIRRRKLHRGRNPVSNEVIVWTDSLLNDEKQRDKDTTEVFAGGIFLPCGPEEAIALASQASHYRIQGQLLGTPSWYTPESIRRNKEAVEGAIICMDFMPEANPAVWREFSQAYQTRYGSAPDKVAGQAFDTIKLLCKAIDQMPPNGGLADLNRLIGETQGYMGVAGQISFGKESHANEDGLIFRALDGSFVRVQ